MIFCKNDYFQATASLMRPAQAPAPKEGATDTHNRQGTWNSTD
jgi:hypothetical protein